MVYRSFAILPAVLLVFLSSIQTFASFPDTVNHQYSNAIDWVQADGIVGGYPDGNYRPDVVINRAEFTKIIVEATVGGTKSGSNCFPDVKNEWFAKYICTAKDQGIVGGNADGTFKPENEVNYAEALKIVLEAYSTDFPRTRTEHWYSKYVDYAIENGLSFANSKLPHSFLTRGEMAEIIYWINNPQPDIEEPSIAPDASAPECEWVDDCWDAGWPDHPFCKDNDIYSMECVEGKCVEAFSPGYNCTVNGLICEQLYYNGIPNAATCVSP